MKQQLGGRVWQLNLCNDFGDLICAIRPRDLLETALSMWLKGTLGQGERTQQLQHKAVCCV